MSISDRLKTQGGYDPVFYKKLARVQDAHFWFRGRRGTVEALLRRYRTSLPSPTRVLELGCGDGDILRVIGDVFTGETIVGMDMHSAGLVIARERVGGLLVRGDAAHPPFLKPFDLVGMFDVLEHLPDDRSMLSEAKRLLNPNGLLILTVPADPALWSYFDEASHHCRRYELTDLTEKLATAGFDVEYATPFMCATYPLLRLGRLLRRVFSHHRQAAEDLSESDLKIWPVLNGVLTFLLEREARQMKQGRRFRRGSSLLAVARKKQTDTEP